jgi:DNA topoisomerase-1
MQMTNTTTNIDDMGAEPATDLEPPTLPDPPKALPTGKQCPVCSGELQLRQGRRGAFLGCSGFPSCRFTVDPDEDVSDSWPRRREPARPPIPSDLPCPLCANEMLEYDGPTGEYLRCTSGRCHKTIDCEGLKAAKGETCPGCRAPMVLRQGRKGAFFGCSRYPECSVTRDASEQSQERLPSSEGKQKERRNDVSAASAS